MKYIIAIVKPSCIDDVHKALVELGISGLTVSEVRGYGRQRGQTEIYRGNEYTIAFVPKIKLEIAVEDGQVERGMETIRSTANTDTIGDGKVFVLDLADALRIRTGETGVDALK